MIAPRLLVIDFQHYKDGRVGRALKDDLLRGWREDAMLLLYTRDDVVMVDAYDYAPRPLQISSDEAAAAIASHFQPEVILCRTGDQAPALRATLKCVFAAVDAPIVLLMEGAAPQAAASGWSENEDLEADIVQMTRLSDVGPKHLKRLVGGNGAAADLRRELVSAAKQASPETIVEHGAAASFDECAFVFHILTLSDRAGVMIDVGAHEGATSLPFAKTGWRVVAVEPDRENRMFLSRRLARFPNVSIRGEALGASPRIGAPFYKSNTSSGISGLDAFDQSHRKSGVVDVITLDALLEQEGVSEVDFLKIDVEGRELDVLNGFDVSAIRPAAIVAEFDHKKGVTAEALCARFAGQSYDVIVSEWRPITAYGAQHSWRRLTSRPEDVDPESWGNIIALQKAPSGKERAGAFSAAFSKTGAPASASAAAIALAGRPPETTIYRRISRYAWTIAPGLSRRISALLFRLRGRSS